MKLNIWKSFNDKNASVSNTLNLQGLKWGSAVRRGYLEMIPLFGNLCPTRTFAPPATALRLTEVTNYGQMILENQSKLPTIVPLHLGYFQNAAQNHAMCVSAILDAGESREFKDACCIQAAQGGYIAEADERFIVLPQPLRAKALALRGEENYSKLWGDITNFNREVGLKERGHLDELKRAYQPELLQTVYHLEPYPNQTGAIFLSNNTVVGIEIAPDAEFWQELHTPLVMYCYAPLRLIHKIKGIEPFQADTLEIDKLKDLEDLSLAWSELEARREERIDKLMQQIQDLTIVKRAVEESKDNNQLVTIEMEDFVGQMVVRDSKVVYVSLSRR
jgi:hypothetical protein